MNIRSGAVLIPALCLVLGLVLFPGATARGAQEPGDPVGLEAEEAWDCYRNGNYECSRRLFRELLETGEDTRQYALGLAYSLRALDRPDRALEVLDSRNLTGGEADELRLGLHSSLGLAAYESQEFETAARHLQRARELAPKDAGLLEVLAWSRYRLGEYDRAFEHFHRLHVRTGNPEAAAAALKALEMADSPRADAYAARLADSQDPVLRKAAADHAWAQGNTLRAWSLYPGPGTCYTGCGSPGLETWSHVSWKDGDPGFSRLFALEQEVSARYVAAQGLELRGGGAYLHLAAGDAPSPPVAGRWYRHLEDPSSQTHAQVESLDAAAPFLAVRGETPWPWLARAGSTPLGGAVDPLPTAVFRLGNPEGWFVQAHQCSLEDSLLSRAGLVDPYGGETWGRVVRAGALAGGVLELPWQAWLSFQAGGDHIYGRNVADNRRAEGSAALGRTSSLGPGYLSLGASTTWMHYHANQDHYTFGHGGYFSPEAFVVSGLFSRWVARDCLGWHLDVEAFAGYMDQDSAAAPRYHDPGPGIAALTDPQAVAEAGGRYPSGGDAGLGCNLAVSAMTGLGGRWAAGVAGGYESSPGHERAQAMVLIRYGFSPRSTLCRSAGLVGRVSPCRP
jgi:tetratricopeptide (TPR) repeat protein